MNWHQHPGMDERILHSPTLWACYKAGLSAEETIIAMDEAVKGAVEHLYDVLSHRLSHTILVHPDAVKDLPVRRGET